jgi:hypothetical protein
MWLRALLAGGLLAGLLSACAVVDPVDHRYDTVSRSLARARNDAIFLNLIRASHDYPLAFTTIANVTPTMSNSTSFGLPAFVLGPGKDLTNLIGGSTSPQRDFIFNNSVASNSTNVGTNFNVSTEETGAFYDGFLKPVDLQTVGYFIRQGYSRELLFWLFADSVEVDLPGGHQIGTRYDPPTDYGCSRFDPKKRCFGDFVLMAIGAGLTVEEKTVQKPAGGNSGSDSRGGGGGKTATTIYSRFCFDSVLARQAQDEMGPKWLEVKAHYLDLPLQAFSPRCGSAWNPQKDASKPQPDYSPFQVGPIQFKIRGRSAYGVFEFLGNLIRIEQSQIPPNHGVIPPSRYREVSAPPRLYTVQRDPSIITVVEENKANCFAHTWFYDGDYCVPEEATTTKRIFSLLAQLIAIETSTTDLSITPIVRVIQ